MDKIVKPFSKLLFNVRFRCKIRNTKAISKFCVNAENKVVCTAVSENFISITETLTSQNVTSKNVKVIFNYLKITIQGLNYLIRNSIQYVIATNKYSD